MRGPIHQTAHILYEVGYFLISLVSRVYNAINGGLMHQTYSARAHIEALEAPASIANGWDTEYNRKWMRAERIINAVFFWQGDHCASGMGHLSAGLAGCAGSGGLSRKH